MDPTSLENPTSPYDSLGGQDVVCRLVTAFYSHMADDEVPLARLHRLDERGRIDADTEARFADFLIEWLGGPRLYSPVHGHPRLRMRHAHVVVDESMRDAWLRAMRSALDDVGASGPVRSFVDQRLSDLANFLRNTSG